MENITQAIKELDVKELHKVKELVQSLIDKKSSVVKPYKMTLAYNLYKGSGKCWVAKVDKDTKKILGFVDAESCIKDGYKGEKVFLLKDGHYLACETMTKTSDKRTYFTILNGEFIED